MSSTFFDKIGDCVLQDCTFIKTPVHHRLYSQKEDFFFFYSYLDSYFSVDIRKRICAELLL